MLRADLFSYLLCLCDFLPYSNSLLKEITFPAAGPSYSKLKEIPVYVENMQMQAGTLLHAVDLLKEGAKFTQRCTTSKQEMVS